MRWTVLCRSVRRGPAGLYGAGLVANSFDC
jgi:hypothetical protein